MAAYHRDRSTEAVVLVRPSDAKLTRKVATPAMHLATRQERAAVAVSGSYLNH